MNRSQDANRGEILHQNQRSGTVLESACHEDSKTVPNCWVCDSNLRTGNVHM